MKKLDGPARSPLRGWLVLNANELTWTALLAVVAVLVGVFMNP